MATTITPAPLVIKTTCTLTLAGKDYSLDTTQTIPLVTNADKRVIPVPTSEVDVVSVVSAAVGKGTLEDFDFIIFVNRDATNFCRLRVKETGGDTADFRLDAGESMIFWNSKLEVNTTAAAFGAFVDFDTFSAQADTATVDLEYLVAQE